MKISVVIPVYNAEKTITKLLDSIENQSYKNYEIIIINDGSTDKTGDILKKYENDYIRIINKNNEGVGRARKLGFQYVTGDLVFFCDSDDYLIDDNVFEKIVNIFKTKNIDILMFDVLDILPNDKKIVSCFSKNFKSGLHDINEINDCFLYGPLFLKIFKSSKLTYDCFSDDNNFEDTYTTYKYLNNCNNFYYVKDVFYVYDETANKKSLTKEKNIDKFIRTIDLIVKMCLESKLEYSCCVSAFNYYIYLISLIDKETSWKYDKVNELKKQMLKLEKIFISKFNFIKATQTDENIQKYYNYKYKNVNKKIFIVDGISTSGKSTISEKIYTFLKLNNINAKWIHEESSNMLNLNLELPRYEVIDKKLLKKEMEILIQKWKGFYNYIKKDNDIYILDSNFFKNIHDYLLYNNISEEEIISYYNRIIDVFENDDVHFILLERKNVKKSFISAYFNRGEFWTTHHKKHIMKKIMSSKKTNICEEEIYNYEVEYQKLIIKIVQQFNICKTRIVTDEEEWDKYVSIILDEYFLSKVQDCNLAFDYNKYIGKFSCENWESQIYYDEHTNQLFLNLFWPRIELKYLGNDIFKLDKFPLYLRYYHDKIVFFGELEWEMKDKDFVKIQSKILKK